MQDNFNIHNWRLKQAITELENKQCPDCGCKMEGTMCNECGYMEEAATFTDKHDDNPKLKGGQKDLPDEVQAGILKKEITSPDAYSAEYRKGYKAGYQDGKENKYPVLENEDHELSEGEIELDFNKKVEDFIAKHINIIKDAAKFYKQQDKNYEYSLIETIYNFLEQELGTDWTTQIATPDPEDEKDFTYGWTDDKDEIFYNALKLILNKKNIKEGEDHEVAMAKSSLQSIMGSCSKLIIMLGDEERNIPGWIQNHITNAENYIDQAAQGFHELDDKNEED